MKYPSPSLLVNFGWKSILVDNAHTSLSLGSICLGNLFLTLYSEAMSIFDIEVCFLYATEWFDIHSVNLYLFIVELMLVVLVCVCFHSFGFAHMKLFMFCVHLDLGPCLISQSATNIFSYSEWSLISQVHIKFSHNLHPRWCKLASYM